MVASGEGGRVTGVGVSGVMKRDSFSKDQLFVATFIFFLFEHLAKFWGRGNYLYRKNIFSGNPFFFFPSIVFALDIRLSAPRRSSSTIPVVAGDQSPHTHFSN